MCDKNFMISLHGIAVCPWSHIWILNVCPFDCTTVTASGKVGHLNFRLTTPVNMKIKSSQIVSFLLCVFIFF